MLDFFDTCVRIGRSRAPDPPGNAKTVDDLLALMNRHHITGAAVEHAVAMEASPRLGHEQLAKDIKPHTELRPAWHLMPAVSDRIERAVTDPKELLDNRVALGRIDARDFCNGIGDRACFAPVLDACAAVHLPVCLDFRRQGDFASFDFGICERYPSIPFVIESFGGYPMHRILWCMREYRNLHLSTVGYQPFDGVKFMCQEIGADRVIYGSDWPAAAAGMAQGSVLLAGISQAERQAIAGGNFLRLLERIGAA